MATSTNDANAGQGNSLAGPGAASFGDGHPNAFDVAVPAGPSQLDVLAETLNVTKRRVKTGSVRVSTRTETHEEIAEVSLDRGVIDVTRVPFDRVVDVAPQVRTEGDTTIVPVVEERLVVTKQLVLVEELHIRHRIEHEVTRTPVALRRQHVEVEHLDADGHPVT